MNLLKSIKELSFVEIFLYASLVAVGLFHVYLSCVALVVLSVKLILTLIQKGSLTLKADLAFISITVMVAFYGLSAIWAIDHGEAILGFFKFLPLVLFALTLMQDESSKEKLLKSYPFAAAILTLVSIPLMYIPALSSYFAVSGRLSGFVQYPNTFAIILLVGELLLINKEKPKLLDYICLAVLLFGILYTGSRTVFVLAVVSNLVSVFVGKSKKVRLTLLGVIAGGIILVLLFCLITNRLDLISRYLNISVFESTFMGRILYAVDILPTVLTHPFGIGYMGYYYIQRSIQTGLYSVMFLHNDLLQIMVDVGWIPFILLVVTIIKTFLNRKVCFKNKIILATMLVHILLDFDLMYVAVFMIFYLFLTPGKEKVITLVPKRVLAFGLTFVFCLSAIYFGTATALSRFGLHGTAVKVYPAYTTSQLALIQQAVTPFEANEIGERVLKHNKYASLAYSAVSRYAYSKGDFAKVIENKTKTLKTARFYITEYKEYAQMLITGYTLYKDAGDKSSANICRKELIALENKLVAERDNISLLGSKIEVKPSLYFPDDIKNQIEQIKLEGEND